MDHQSQSNIAKSEASSDPVDVLSHQMDKTNINDTPAPSDSTASPNIRYYDTSLLKPTSNIPSPDGQPVRSDECGHDPNNMDCPCCVWKHRKAETIKLNNEVKLLDDQVRSSLQAANDWKFDHGTHTRATVDEYERLMHEYYDLRAKRDVVYKEYKAKHGRYLDARDEMYNICGPHIDEMNKFAASTGQYQDYWTIIANFRHNKRVETTVDFVKTKYEWVKFVHSGLFVPSPLVDNSPIPEQTKDPLTSFKDDKRLWYEGNIGFGRINALNIMRKMGWDEKSGLGRTFCDPVARFSIGHAKERLGLDTNTEYIEQRPDLTDEERAEHREFAEKYAMRAYRTMKEIAQWKADEIAAARAEIRMRKEKNLAGFDNKWLNWPTEEYPPEAMVPEPACE